MIQSAPGPCFLKERKRARAFFPKCTCPTSIRMTVHHVLRVGDCGQCLKIGAAHRKVVSCVRAVPCHCGPRLNIGAAHRNEL